MNIALIENKKGVTVIAPIINIIKERIPKIM